MSPEEINAIVGGYHADAFRILGPHHTETGWTVRAFLPHAKTAAVQISGKRTEMQRIHEAGFFTSEGDYVLIRAIIHVRQRLRPELFH